MSVFVLVGGPFEILDTPLEGQYHLSQCVLGARFELDDEQARRTILHGAALVPAEAFQGFGFTADELKRYPNARFHEGAPEEFLTKYARAIEEFHAFRAALSKVEAV